MRFIKKNLSNPKDSRITPRDLMISTSVAVLFFAIGIFKIEERYPDPQDTLFKILSGTIVVGSALVLCATLLLISSAAYTANTAYEQYSTTKEAMGTEKLPFWQYLFLSEKTKDEILQQIKDLSRELLNQEMENTAYTKALTKKHTPGYFENYCEQNNPATIREKTVNELQSTIANAI